MSRQVYGRITNCRRQDRIHTSLASIRGASSRQRGLTLRWFPGKAQSSHNQPRPIKGTWRTSLKPWHIWFLSSTPSIPTLFKSCELYLHSAGELTPPPHLSHRRLRLDPSDSLPTGPLIPLLPLQSTLQIASQRTLSEGKWECATSLIKSSLKASVTLRANPNLWHGLPGQHDLPMPVSFPTILPSCPRGLLAGPVLPHYCLSLGCSSPRYPRSSLLASSRLFSVLPHQRHLSPMHAPTLTPRCSILPSFLLDRISYFFTVGVTCVLPICLTRMKTPQECALWPD